MALIFLPGKNIFPRDLPYYVVPACNAGYLSLKPWRFALRPAPCIRRITFWKWLLTGMCRVI